MDEQDLFGQLAGEFLLEAAQRIDQIEQTLLRVGESPAANTAEALNDIRRELHTLKGNAGMMGLHELQHRTHAMEELLAGAELLSASHTEQLLSGVDDLRALVAAAAPSSDGTSEAAGDGTPSGLLIAASAIDAMVDMVADSMILGSHLSGLLAAVGGDKGERLVEAYEALQKNLTAIHRRALALRLVPLKPLFANLHRLVHDESLGAGKEIRFEAAGGDTPLDKALMDVAAEALGHIVRNAVIHGIERPEERRSRGKMPGGVIRAVAASSGAEEICVTVTDDGNGIDRARLTAAAARVGHAVEEGEALENLLFLPGLSTLEEATISAGRGIGLSASMSAVRRLGGRIEVESKPGQGTTFRLYLPVQVSMLRVMLVEADGERYAIPLIAVSTVARMQPGELHLVNGAGTLGAGALGRRRGLLPLLDLGVAFGTASEIRESGTVLTVAVGGSRRGLLVDRPGEVLDCVIKPLDPICGAVSGVLGTTILSEGRVLLALDPAGLLERPLVRGAA
jgi:two-component system chemotaxis sensor kinase CheA